MKKEFDSEPVFNKEYSVISLDFALKKDDNYYLQVFLKECKFSEKKSS